MGDIEHGKCDICKSDAPINRKYYYYPIECDCCNSKKDNHFEIVRHCSDCIPVPPKRVSAVLEPIQDEKPRIFYESVQHKMPEHTNDFKLLNKPYQKWDDFFDEHAEGRRSGYGRGIDQRFLGYAGDVTLFWKSEEEYPFAYVFPLTMNENFESGYFFYIKDTK